MYYVSVFMIMVFIGGVLIVLRALAGSPQIDELKDIYQQNSEVDVDTPLPQIKDDHVNPEGKEQSIVEKV